MNLKQQIEKVIPFVERSGLRVIHLEAGKVTCEMPTENNLNHFNAMYAGAQFTLADITGGALLLATFSDLPVFPTLKNLTMNFLKPATSPLHLSLSLTRDQIQTMSTQVQKENKAHCQLQGDLVDRTGIVISQMSGDFYLLKNSG